MDNCVSATKQMLKILDVKHTSQYLNDILLSHPDHPSLLAISDTFDKYKIANLAICDQNQKSLFFILILITLPFFSCNEQQPNQKDKTLSSSSISEPVDSISAKVFISARTDDPGIFDYFNVFNYSYINGATNYQLKEQVENDSVKLEIGAVETPKILEIMAFGNRDKASFYNTRVFATPEDSITMHIENGKFRFYGHNETHYNFFPEMDSLNLEWPAFKGSIRRYKKNVEAVYLKKRKFFESYVRDNKVSEEFKLIVGGELKFEYLYNLVAPRSGETNNITTYYNEVGGLAKALGSSSSEGDFIDMDDYFDGVTIEDFQRPELINNDYFKRSLTAFVRFYFMDQDHIYYTEDALEEEESFIENNFEGDLEQYALGRMIYDHIENYNYGLEQSKYLLSLMEEYKKNPLPPPSQKLMDGLYKQTLAVEKITDVERDFSEGALNTKLITRTADTISLEEIFRLTKGKTKVIHIWASWCPPLLL